MYQWVQRVIFFLNLSTFHSSCADLISVSSIGRTVALSLCRQGRKNQCSGLYPHLSLSFIHLSPGTLLMFPVSAWPGRIFHMLHKARVSLERVGTPNKLQGTNSWIIYLCFGFFFSFFFLTFLELLVLRVGDA